MELDDLCVDRLIWHEPDVLVGDEEQQRVGAEGESGGVGPNRTGAGFAEIDGKVVGAGRVARLAIESQAMGANRMTAPAGVVQIVGDVTLGHIVIETISLQGCAATLSLPPYFRSGQE